MPRCGQESRIANGFPSSVRPSTSGISSSIAVASPRPRIAVLRIAGYQDSHKNPRSLAEFRAPSASPPAAMEDTATPENESFITLRHPSIGFVPAATPLVSERNCSAGRLVLSPAAFAPAKTVPLRHVRFSVQLRGTNFGAILKSEQNDVCPFLLTILLPEIRHGGSPVSTLIS